MPARNSSLQRILVVVGPTASGKSDLAVSLAKKFNGEVVSADSRQVYRGLDIGSGKITRRGMRGVRHHLLSVASPRTLFTAERYRRRAARSVADILRRGKLPIVCGGTGFYIDALLHNRAFPPVPPNAPLRKKIGALPANILFATLKKLDPRRADAIDPHNKPRLVRALEILYGTKKPIPRLAEQEVRYDAHIVGIAVSPRELARRIRLRLAKRLRQGMLAEVAKLHARGVSWKRLDGLGLEYRYASRHLQGLLGRNAMIEAIEKESIRYAKRQMTWWKRNPHIRWTRNPRKAYLPVAAWLKKSAAQRTTHDISG